MLAARPAGRGKIYVLELTLEQSLLQTHQNLCLVLCPFSLTKQTNDPKKLVVQKHSQSDAMNSKHQRQPAACVTLTLVKIRACVPVLSS